MSQVCGLSGTQTLVGDARPVFSAIPALPGRQFGRARGLDEYHTVTTSCRHWRYVPIVRSGRQPGEIGTTGTISSMDSRMAGFLGSCLFALVPGYGLPARGFTGVLGGLVPGYRLVRSSTGDIGPLLVLIPIKGWQLASGLSAANWRPAIIQ
ncbi:unnamed protein product [Calypogeia fissa]